MAKMILLFLCFITNAVFADIFEIKEISQVDKYLTENSLVIFDLDNTLIETYQTLGSDQWFYNRMEEYKKNGKNAKEAFEYTYPEWFQIQCITKVKTVEKDTIKQFQRVQKKSSAIALTTRSFDLNFPTFLQLSSVGIDFSKNAISQNTFFFDGERYIVYKNGILFANGLSKATALGKLFHALKFQPKEIIFIDDRVNHLKDVEAFCNDKKIKFTGLRYSYLDEKINSIDLKLAQKQLMHFGKILTDEEAKLLIN